MRLDGRKEALYETEPSGHLASPEIEDTEHSVRALGREIAQTYPTSPEGVARMLDVYWRDYACPAHLVGTEDWQEEMDSPDMRFLLHVRNSAALVAGLGSP